MRTTVASITIAVAGLFVLWSGTDGARAFTSEGARRLAVREAPRPLPAAVLEDQAGARLALEQWRGRLLVVDFIYTRCPDLCVVAGNSLQRVAAALPSGSVGREVVLLSISFDSLGDTPDRLDYYARRHQAEAGRWHVGRVVEDGALRRLLDTFGVTVIPDGWGGFQHNAALYVVDRRGRLLAIFDYDDPDAVVGFLKGHLQP